jgi:topoisomerase IA-like protein
MNDESSQLGKKKSAGEDFFTPTENQFLELGQKNESLQKTCDAMQITRSRGYQILANIRLKRDRAHKTAGKIDGINRKALEKKHWLAKGLVIVKRQVLPDLASEVDQP